MPSPDPQSLVVDTVPHGQQLATLPSSTLSAPVAPSIGQMLAGVIDKGVTTENVGVLEKLLAVYERMEDRNAEKNFNSAFVALQADLPVIVATSIIPNRGKYERFEDVMRVVSPLLAKHGFSVSFSMENKDSRITETCHLRHIGGHSQSNSFSLRSGGKADSELQADCKAATTAKRNALLNCLNIVIRQDALMNEDDVANEGEVIAPDKAQYLREQLREVGGSEVGFLAVAGVDSWDKITSGSYDVLLRMINSKRKK